MKYTPPAGKAILITGLDAANSPVGDFPELRYLGHPTSRPGNVIFQNALRNIYKRICVTCFAVRFPGSVLEAGYTVEGNEAISHIAPPTCATLTQTRPYGVQPIRLEKNATIAGPSERKRSLDRLISRVLFSLGRVWCGHLPGHLTIWGPLGMTLSWTWIRRKNCIAVFARRVAS